MDNNEKSYNESKKVSIISLICNLFLAIFKLLVGFNFNSRALVADGFHSFSDVASTLIIIISIRISKQPPDKRHPYGHGKAESIGTKILGLILIFTGLFLLQDVINLIIEQQVSIPGFLVLVMAAVSILVKESLYHYIKRVGEKINSKGLIADAYHHRTDAISSIAALIGAGGAYLGFPILDPLAGGIVALFIIRIGIKIWLDAIDELMDARPDSVELKGLLKELEELNDVVVISDIKFRSYGNYIFVDLKVVVDDNLTVVEGHEIAVDVKRRIKQANKDIVEVMVHIDPEVVYIKNQ